VEGMGGWGVVGEGEAGAQAQDSRGAAAAAAEEEEEGLKHSREIGYTIWVVKRKQERERREVARIDDSMW
jgi:hypothetical protein